MFQLLSALWAPPAFHHGRVHCLLWPALPECSSLRGAKAESFLMAAAFASPTFPGNGIDDLWTNRVFLVGFWAWFLAQFGKVGLAAGHRHVDLMPTIVRAASMLAAPCAGRTRAAACLPSSVALPGSLRVVGHHAGSVHGALGSCVRAPAACAWCLGAAARNRLRQLRGPLPGMLQVVPLTGFLAAMPAPCRRSSQSGTRRACGT